MNYKQQKTMDYHTASNLRPGDLVSFKEKGFSTTEPCDRFTIGHKYPVVNTKTDESNVVITVRLPSCREISYGMGWFHSCVTPQGTYPCAPYLQYPITCHPEYMTLVDKLKSTQYELEQVKAELAAIPQTTLDHLTLCSLGECYPHVLKELNELKAKLAQLSK